MKNVWLKEEKRPFELWEIADALNEGWAVLRECEEADGKAQGRLMYEFAQEVLAYCSDSGSIDSYGVVLSENELSVTLVFWKGEAFQGFNFKLGNYDLYPDVA